jgi:hypothetical protein
MQVAIYEMRHNAVKLSNEDEWIYFGKPNESMCKENLKFII